MISIRRATVSDVAFLYEVEKKCFNDPWNDLMLESEILDPFARFYIFTEDEIDVGYYSYLHVLDEAHILTIAVLPEFQGKGYGKAEMRDLLERTLSEGATNVTLEVRRSNLKAIALYESFGFTLSGARPKYYMDGEDALIYWLYR